MLLNFILEKWKRILIQYILGVGILFYLFYTISELKEPVYRSKMIMAPVSSPVEVATAVGDLFMQMSTKDTITLISKLSLDINEFQRIVGFEFDILEGGLIEIQLLSKDVAVIPLFFKSMINYLNEDSVLNALTHYKRTIISDQIRFLENELRVSDSIPVGKNEQWVYASDDSRLMPVVGSSQSLRKLFLQDRLNELRLEIYQQNSVRAFNDPLIPKFVERSSLLVYFLFSNIIVFSLLFIQFLIYSSKRAIDHNANG